MTSTIRSYSSGDRVRVTDGPFASFEARIREVRADPAHLKLDVFVRDMIVPAVMEPWQVEKTSE